MDEILLTQRPDGTFEEYVPPYATIVCQTAEDYDCLCALLLAKKEGRLVVLSQVCGMCSHFTGAGDFDLCCTANKKRLCYATSDASGCDSYERIESEAANADK